MGRHGRKKRKGGGEWGKGAGRRWADGVAEEASGEGEGGVKQGRGREKKDGKRGGHGGEGGEAAGGEHGGRGWGEAEGEAEVGGKGGGGGAGQDVGKKLCGGARGGQTHVLPSVPAPSFFLLHSMRPLVVANVPSGAGQDVGKELRGGARGGSHEFPSLPAMHHLSSSLQCTIFLPPYIPFVHCSFRTVSPGAGQDVGKSCVVVRVGGRVVMFDCGMHMGYQDARRFPRLPPPARLQQRAAPSVAEAGRGACGLHGHH
ncbi:unnamed protein product [Closterium sp. NIES-64]|nr:unnamed protein product [Closterium sp. NIES-64]